MARPPTPTGSMRTRKPPNDAPLQMPTSMFCGLPVIESTDPTLAPMARPSRYGVGRTRSGPSAASSTGVTTRQTVSFTNRADRSPPPTTTPSSRRLVIRTLNAEVGTRNRMGRGRPRMPRFPLDGRSICSAFRLPRSAFLDLPIREQHPVPRVRLAVPFVGHAEVGPADAIAAGDQPAERVVEARLTAHGDAPDARARRRRLGRRDARLEGPVVARRPPEHPHPAFRPGR